MKHRKTLAPALSQEEREFMVMALSRGEREFMVMALSQGGEGVYGGEIAVPSCTLIR